MDLWEELTSFLPLMITRTPKFYGINKSIITHCAINYLDCKSLNSFLLPESISNLECYIMDICYAVIFSCKT